MFFITPNHGACTIFRNKDKTLLRKKNSNIFYLPHQAGGSQVLLAPPQFLLALGKRAMLNVEP